MPVSIAQETPLHDDVLTLVSEPAWRLYERGGFTQCGVVLDYSDSGYSRFYEKKLG